MEKPIDKKWFVLAAAVMGFLLQHGTVLAFTPPQWETFVIVVAPLLFGAILLRVPLFNTGDRCVSRRPIVSSLQHRIGITRARLARHAHDRRRRRKHFQTAATTTRARNAAKRIDTHVANFRRRAIHATP